MQAQAPPDPLTGVSAASQATRSVVRKQPLSPSREAGWASSPALALTCSAREDTSRCVRLLGLSPFFTLAVHPVDLSAFPWPPGSCT